MSDAFYREFEDRHRGSRDLIKSRLAVYLPFITSLQSLSESVTALDLGCGRGEWLELLKENGIDALGVDLDAGMLAACHERGLTVELKDALSALREAPAESFSIVSAFHVVEHIPFQDLRTLAREAHRVLKPGGLLILETPNPENLSVGSTSFYMDPSHERPIPSLLLDFVVEHSGFHRTKILRLQESPELRDASELALLDVLKGVSPDYSVVAQKSTTPEVLAVFDPLFETEYGLSLDALAHRYDVQSQTRVNSAVQQVETQLSQVNEYLQHVENFIQHARTELSHTHGTLTAMEDRFVNVDSRLDDSENRFAIIESRLADSDNRFANYENRLAHIEASYAAQIQAMLNSRSWKITAPLRFVGGAFYRFRSAAKDGRLKSGLKRRIKTRLRTLGHAVLSRPQLAQSLFRVLDRMPGLKQRLRQIILDPATAAPAQTQVIERHSDLSPRAEYVYARLKQHIDVRNN